MKRTRTAWPWLTLAILLASCAGSAHGGAAGAGTRAFEFLRLPAEPVGRSLAGAHLASVSGVGALAWNPAGLAGAESGECLLAHATWMAETAWDWGGLALPLGADAGALGLSCGLLRSGSLEGYDSEGRKTGDFSPVEAMASLGYGRDIGRGVRAGLSAELAYRRDDLGEDEAAWAGGAGLQCDLGRVTLGAALLHAAPEQVIEGERYPLPATLRGGLTLTALGGMRFHAAAEWVTRASPRALAGWEWNPGAGLRALAGVLHDPDAAEQVWRPACGIEACARRLRVAYSFQPLAGFEPSHQVALGLDFDSASALRF